MQGTLSEFTLAELLQLFALSEKTGMVTISTDRQCSRLFLRAGRIAGWGNDSFNVHEAVMQCELLPADSMAALENLSAQPGKPGLAFIVKNLVEPYRWTAFVQRTLEQDIYPVLNIEHGDFEIAITSMPSVPVRVDVSVQQLVLDGSRWEADMTELTQAGYGIESSWQRRTPAAGSLRRELSQLDWLVWSMLREPMTVGEVARRICTPDLDTCHSVRRLHSDSLLDRPDG